jgi:inner membrane protein YidH
MIAAPETQFDARPTASNHFSWINTLLSLQRTLMAATRTAVSLIGFGFTVAEFFRKTREGVPENLRVMHEEGPRNFGLALIGAGVISLALFTWQYNASVRQLRRGVFGSLAGDAGRSMFAPVYIVAGAVLLIGVAAFVTIYMRL